MSQVILAEDEAQLRRLISAMLMDRGVSVTEAADGAEALQRLQDDPSASLLLSDIVMPNMNGYELVEASLKLRPELKILMMTAYADQPDLAWSAVRLGANRVLSKPFDLKDLPPLVDQLNRSRPL